MKAFKHVFTIFLLIILLLVIYGGVIEPRLLLDEQKTEARLPYLPAEWEGRRVALLADFQVGMWWDNTGMVSKAVDRIISWEADMVLICGDFVYKPDTAVVNEAVDLVRPLAEANIPVYAVLGNHDYSLMKKESNGRPEIARYLAQQLEEAGIVVLENESVNVGSGTGPLYVVGIGSEWAGNSLPDQAMAGISADDARIIFMHNPVAYRDFAPRTAPLTLAGHTHGGQLRLPLLPSESWLDIARDREVVAEGWSSEKIDKPGNRLYVNRGIGFSLIPMRLFCRPELTMITLKGAEGYMEDKDPGEAE
ncbi:metallophosphoesterase [Roseivirga sp. BDSF3-8]|uniref:metallophosphoesterase n=1 Tax=Roseivirga sp. BDSF3-8 TaxID=3241598 RepID=UPI0035322C92